MTTTITPEDTILSIVAASPRREVHGKKRIQKLSFLCKLADSCVQSRFRIRHFGVFSAEIADALELLSTFGDLDTREEQVGPNRYFSTVFSLPERSDYAPNDCIVLTAGLLSSYSTPILEVASTIAFFHKNEGWTESDAVKETKKLKPAISTAERVQISKDLLKKLNKVSTTAHEQRSKSP